MLTKVIILALIFVLVPDNITGFDDGVMSVYSYMSRGGGGDCAAGKRDYGCRGAFGRVSPWRHWSDDVDDAICVGAVL